MSRKLFLFVVLLGLGLAAVLTSSAVNRAGTVPTSVLVERAMLGARTSSSAMSAKREMNWRRIPLENLNAWRTLTRTSALAASAAPAMGSTQ
jgi:hypothetical protein